MKISSIGICVNNFKGKIQKKDKNGNDFVANNPIKAKTTSFSLPFFSDFQYKANIERMQNPKPINRLDIIKNMPCYLQNSDKIFDIMQKFGDLSDDEFLNLAALFESDEILEAIYDDTFQIDDVSKIIKNFSYDEVGELIDSIDSPFCNIDVSKEKRLKNWSFVLKCDNFLKLIKDKHAPIFEIERFIEDNEDLNINSAIKFLQDEFFFNTLMKLDYYDRADFILKISYIAEEDFDRVIELLKILPEQYHFRVKDIVDIENNGVFENMPEKISNGLGIQDLERLRDISFCANKDLSKFPSRVKLKILDLLYHINSLSDEVLSKKEKEQVENLIQEVQKFLESAIVPYDVSKKDTGLVMKEFFANQKDIENVLKMTDFTQFKKQGLPLKYSRKEFLHDLKQILSIITQDKKAEILNKLDIELTMDEKGYDGFINLSKINPRDALEKRVLDIAAAFIKNNSVETDNPKLNKALNALISAMPEFVNIIGKQQHDTHTLSLDIHILTVLKEAMANKNYNKLSNIDKTCLKFAIIMHDIAKKENIIDNKHPEYSALIARDILKRYSFPSTFKDRVYELIENHHWLAKYNRGEIKPYVVAVYFRRKNDFDIAKIMAQADLKGISDEFYNLYSIALDDEKLQPVVKSLNNIQSLGQLLFLSKIINKNLIPEITYNGDKYKVLNFTEVSDDKDLSCFGYPKTTTKDSIRLCVHMVDDVLNLNTLNYLSDIKNKALLCASYISLDNKHTYYNKKFGLSLDMEQTNIANASSCNQSSGRKKSFSLFCSMLSQRILNFSDYRMLVPGEIKLKLGLDDNEYAQLYKQLLNKKYYTQIKDEDIFEINKKQFLGSKVREAIRIANDKLLCDTQNEINAYSPKINAFVAKVDSIDEVPDDFLKFAKQNGLPVLLLGS